VAVVSSRAVSVDDVFDVVVVGGGLAGLTLAMALCERGHPTAVLEARRGVAPVKRGMSLAPNGLQVLDRLGLLRDVEEIGRRLHVVKYLKESGELLVSYDYRQLNCKQNYLLAFLPHELEAVLRRRTEGRHVKIFGGAKFDGFLREYGRISGVWATIDGAQRSLRSKIIIGADGGRSVVRQAAGIQARSEPYNSSYAVTVADMVENSSDEAKHYLGKGKMLGDFPLPHGKYLFSYLPVGTYDGLKARGLDRFKAELAALAPELSETLESIESWDDFSYMIPQDVRVDSWVGDNVALVGDAAHSIEPSLGQGGSLALSDVNALLDVLDVCFGKSDFSANVLKGYEAARRTQTETLRRMAELTAMLMNTHNGVLEWFRDRTMRKMRENPKAMALALDTATGMKNRVTLAEKLRIAGFL
jgi:2-polyprenyl-6-methoxyphenol hydroxylase-like FAD-dependent oxidoreductase